MNRRRQTKRIEIGEFCRLGKNAKSLVELVAYCGPKEHPEKRARVRWLSSGRTQVCYVGALRALSPMEQLALQAD